MQRSLGDAWMAEAGYIRTDGRNFPLSRPLANAFDRQTGARPNPGARHAERRLPDQRADDGLQRAADVDAPALRHDLGLGFHYTYSRGYAEQGGSLASNFVNSDYFVTQDFFDPFFDRNPLSQEARHRIAVDAIYQMPSFRAGLAVAGPRRLADLRHRVGPHRRAAARDPAVGHQPTAGRI